MFTVKVGDRKYKVEFEYDRIGFDKIIRTHCFIDWVSDIGERSLHNSASAIVHPRETPDKNMGRKISLHRALNTGFDKFERKLFWEAYYNARGGKW